MSNSQHTPTPWIWNKEGVQKFKHGFIMPIITGHNRKHICVVSSSVNEVWNHPKEADEMYANAELIVRAVNCHDDLVRALSNLLDAYYIRSGDAGTPAQLLAESVLAKAKS